VQLVLAFIPELVCHLLMGKHFRHDGLGLHAFAVEELDGRTKLDLAAEINKAIGEQQTVAGTSIGDVANSATQDFCISELPFGRLFCAAPFENSECSRPRCGDSGK